MRNLLGRVLRHFKCNKVAKVLQLCTFYHCALEWWPVGLIPFISSYSSKQQQLLPLKNRLNNISWNCEATHSNTHIIFVVVLFVLYLSCVVFKMWVTVLVYQCIGVLLLVMFYGLVAAASTKATGDPNKQISVSVQYWFGSLQVA